MEIKSLSNDGPSTTVVLELKESSSEINDNNQAEK